MESPSPGTVLDDSQLFGVSAVSVTDAWAAGLWVSGSEAASAPLLEHWDGTRWTAVRPHVRSDQGFLHDVALVSGAEGWAVGWKQMHGEGSRPLLLHWDGERWLEAPFSPPTSYGTYVEAVEAVRPDLAWAVGYYLSTPYAGSERTLALRWDGRAWERVPTPNPSELGDFLEDVVVVTPSDAWAVGSVHPGDKVSSTLAMHWDGIAWSHVPTPDQGDQENELAGVGALSPTDVWAVGGSRDEGDTRSPILERWDGSAWSLEPLVNRPEGDLFGVSRVGEALVAVGSARDSHSFSAIRAGDRWRLVPTVTPGDFDGLVAVDATSPEDIWAVGHSQEVAQSRTLVQHHCPR